MLGWIKKILWLTPAPKAGDPVISKAGDRTILIPAQVGRPDGKRTGLAPALELTPSDRIAGVRAMAPAKPHSELHTVENPYGETPASEAVRVRAAVKSQRESRRAQREKIPRRTPPKYDRNMQELRAIATKRDRELLRTPRDPKKLKGVRGIYEGYQ